jgi:ferredoxin
VQGGEALSTPDEFELEVLDIFGDTPDKVRLCCQTKLISAPATEVTLKVCED